MSRVPYKAIIAFAAAATLAVAGAPAAAEVLTLKGVMTGADHQTYREAPFRVPAGVTSITVEFAYTGKDQKAVIDLGLRDPQRFRGWSGGGKARFTVSETWATASYLPGPLPAGEWKLILGVPNLRKDGRADYTARITLQRDGAFHGFAAAPLKDAAGWYRGDLHTHTAHSDGSCAAQSGAKVPCPVFRTTEAAAARGLDFIAVTDHNTTSHFEALAELQPYYDRLLLIPGRELTTFQGHAGVLGMTAPLEFQLGGPRAPDLRRILDRIEAAQALISLNHPGLPSGEACMGCGWTAKTDFSRVQAVEVVNGGVSSGPFSGVPFWEARLNAGLRITAIGGSDNHDAGLDPTRAPAVGLPTTVVHAAALSQDAILAAVRAGHAFVDVKGTGDRLLDVSASLGGATAQMGDVLIAPAGADVRLQIHVAHAAGGRVVLRSDPGLAASGAFAVTSDDAKLDAAVRSDGAAHWVRADVLGPDGSLWLLGNPIYLRP